MPVYCQYIPCLPVQFALLVLRVFEWSVDHILSETLCIQSWPHRIPRVSNKFLYNMACQNLQVLVALFLIYRSRSPSFGKFVASSTHCTLHFPTYHTWFSHLLSRHITMILTSKSSQAGKRNALNVIKYCCNISQNISAISWVNTELMQPRWGRRYQLENCHLQQ